MHINNVSVGVTVLPERNGEDSSPAIVGDWNETVRFYRNETKHHGHRQEVRKKNNR
jgi:hypothetical protein